MSIKNTNSVSYTTIKGTYTKVPCTVDDIENDLNTAQNILKDIGEDIGDVEEYTSYMRKSIEQGMAYAVLHNDKRVGFMYLRKDRAFPGCLVASSASWHKDTIALMILTLTIDLSKYQAIIVFPHGKNLLKFKSLITLRSLMLYNSGKSKYVVIPYNKHRFRLFVNIAKLFKLKKVK